MLHGFRKFISEVFMNGKFPKISRYMVVEEVEKYFNIHEVVSHPRI